MKLSDVHLKVPPVLKISNARKKIKEMNEKMRTKLAVLDDDPTGCQTVYDVRILLDWEENLLNSVLKGNDVFYILTNTRAYSEKKAGEIDEEVVTRLLKYVDPSLLKVISRSDSTLRGHFGLEVKVLLDSLGPFDGVIVVPYFKEGGRFTLFDTHYVLQGEDLVEAHRTEFASDPVFSFKNSYLPAWIEEKSGGIWKEEDVISISIDDIRIGGIDRVYEVLKDVRDTKPVIMNCLDDEDLEVFILGLLKAESEGKRFLYRTAASFVKIRAGIEDRETVRSFLMKKGIIIVGSFVKKTTEQLEALLEDFPLDRVELKISKILSEERTDYLKGVVERMNEALLQDKSIVVYTERDYAIPDLGKEEQLRSGETISLFLADIVKNLKVSPDFLIAKGGITSYIVAKEGLGVKVADVIGQIAPGVPVWKLRGGCRFPDLFYIVFPGNVGDRLTLSRIFSTLIDISKA